MLADGSFGQLTSTIPPLTFPAWKSMTSGVNPGKIGVYGFLKIYLSQKKALLNVAISNCAKDFWEYISKQGHVCSIINVPGTWPIKRINGYIIAGPMVLDTMDYTYPPNLKKFIIEKFGYRINPISNLKGNSKVALNEFLSIIKSRFSATKYLMNKSSFTFLVLYYIDNLLHFHWDKLENSPDKNPILKALMLIDKEVNKILHKYSGNIDLMVVSDHGMTEKKGGFRLNTYFYNKGLIALTKDPTHQFPYTLLRTPSMSHEIERISSKIYKIIGEKLLKMLKITKADYFRKIYLMIHSKGDVPDHELIKFIDTQRTICFAHGYGVYLNKDVIGATSKQTINEIRNILLSITNPENKEKIINNVWSTNEIYGNKIKQPAPELLFLPAEGYEIHFELSHELWKKNGWKAVHKRNGLFLAYGPDFTDKGYVGEISIYDVAPTILHLYSIGIPAYFDGKVRKELFSTKSDVFKKKIRFGS